MKLLKVIVSTIVVLTAAGCVVAPQKGIELNRTVLSSPSGTVGVAMTALPKVDTFLPGASCLLCIAAAAGANSSLTKHANTLPYEGLDKLKETVAESLRTKGINAVVITEPVDVRKLKASGGKAPNAAKKNFSVLREQHKVDRLLLIDIQQLGFIRSYSSYFPTSDPKAFLVGASYIVDLTSNNYDWYLPLDIQKSAEGAWDEPPQFPGLTNAYFQTVEIAKDSIQKPLAN